MQAKRSLDGLLFDRRILDRNLRQSALTHEEFEQHLAQLPDAQHLVASASLDDDDIDGGDMDDHDIDDQDMDDHEEADADDEPIVE